VTNNPDLHFFQCGNNPFIFLDLTYNTNLTYIEIRYCYDLREMCVWELPFPPPGVTLSAYGINVGNIHFMICHTDIRDNTLSLEKQPLFSPNPTTGHIAIQANRVRTVELLTLTGKRLLSASDVTELDLSEFPEGLYILRMLTDKGVVTEKIVIM